MAAAKQKMTFEEYLNYDDGGDRLCEFIDGELVEMPPESPLNSKIAKFLFAILLSTFSEDLICYKDTEIAVVGYQVRTRLPDLIVLSEELAAILAESNRGTITPEMPPPELIVEVVSPGITNQQRDYRYKRSEYAARGVAEYWVIDPEENKITVFTLESGFYEEAIYTGEMVIASRFAVLQLTPIQIFNRKR